MNDLRPKADPPLKFASLAIDDWRQFDLVNIEFHPRLTVLTGANATGKSTILGILARHFNWQRAYSSAPVSVRGKDGRWTAIGKRRARKLMRESGWENIGELSYSDGARTPISVPTGDVQDSRFQYDLLLPHQRQVPGAFLASHRSVSGNYTPVDSIPTIFGDPLQLFEQFTNELRTRWSGGWTGRAPQVALKEALIAAAVFGGRGSRAVEYNPHAAAIWDGFQEVLQRVMPPSIGFRGLRVRVPDVVVSTAKGDFILDDASGGLSAIIEIAWQIFLRSKIENGFTVIIDEPENHLHPSLQRDILPSLLEAFPNVQFVVATHSPFVVTATPNSFVYALDYIDDNEGVGWGGRVYSRKLDYANKAANADETLRRVLGLESTFPRWAELKFDSIVSRYSEFGLDALSLREMREELRQHGLVSGFPDAVLRVTDQNRWGGEI